MNKLSLIVLAGMCGTTVGCIGNLGGYGGRGVSLEFGFQQFVRIGQVQISHSIRGRQCLRELDFLERSEVKCQVRGTLLHHPSNLSQTIDEALNI